MGGRLSELGKRLAPIIDLYRRQAADAEIRISSRAQQSGQPVSGTAFDAAMKRMLESRRLLEENGVEPIVPPEQP